MGVYIYKTKPSHIAVAIVALSDDSQIETEIALYQYAYKPYRWGGDAANARMRFVSGVTACESAYERSGRSVPRYGLLIGEDGCVHEEMPRVFEAGSVDIEDDYVTYSATVVKFLKLPRGIYIKEEKTA